jgi:phosphodiesterase/alkaline phosphatase D-like protein
MREQALVSRRAFLSLLAMAGAGPLAASWPMPQAFAQGSPPAVITPDAKRPAIPYGIASGDVTSDAAIIWSRTDRPSRMIVEYATTDSFKNSKRVVGPAALAASDFTARVDVTIWKNVTTLEKAKMAETLGEFRGNYVYNLMDEHIRAFNAEVAQFFQWDDHEVTNTWFPGGVIDDRNPRYQQYMVKSHDLLAVNAKRAFLEYLPLRLDPQDPERIYRAFNYGPSLDMFMIDERSWRKSTPSS